MPNHLRDIELLELIGGHLSDAAATAANEHLAACPDCARRHRRMRRLWQLLGRWQLPADTSRARPAPSSPREAQKAGRPVRWWSLAGPLRLAAVLALAAGVGAAAGWLTPAAPIDDEARESARWLKRTPWEVWHEPTPARLAESMRIIHPQAGEESPS